MKGNCGPTKLHFHELWLQLFLVHTFPTQGCWPSSELLGIPPVRHSTGSIGSCVVLWQFSFYPIFKLGFLQVTMILQAFINLDLNVGGHCECPREVRDVLQSQINLSEQKKMDPSVPSRIHVTSKGEPVSHTRGQSVFHFSMTKGHMIWEPMSMRCTISKKEKTLPSYETIFLYYAGIFSYAYWKRCFGLIST